MPVDKQQDELSADTIIVPAFTDILQYTVELILSDYAVRAPDFSNLVILLPHEQAVQDFRLKLCQQSGTNLPAIIPPWSGTLRNWLTHYCDQQNSLQGKHDDTYQTIDDYARELLFIEALQQHPGLFKEENKWQVTRALLKLFDELALNQVNSCNNLDEWQQQIEAAYQIKEPHRNIQALSDESRIVYTLWQAWQQQLASNQHLDESSDLLLRLSVATSVIRQHSQQNEQKDNNISQFICLSPSIYTKVEQQFISQLVDQGRCQIIEYQSTLSQSGSSGNIGGSTKTKDDFCELIKVTFDDATATEDVSSIKIRAQDYARNHPHISIENTPFSIYLASDDEQQVRAIDYYIRLNLLEGKRQIGIISEDRKLSRRLRALLERSNVPLSDKAGWSLSTTKAATVIERWLECIEENFSAYPLLDCMKSPFVKLTEAALGEVVNDEEIKKNIYRFEHDLVFHENVSSDISQYKKQLKYRLNKLEHWPETTYDQLINMLDFIEQSARPLRECYLSSITSEPERNSNKSAPLLKLSTFLEALIHSLQQIGVLQRYQEDEAGLILLQTFDKLKNSVEICDPLLNWNDCRSWLGTALESTTFAPSTEKTVVRLMTLEQASHLNFDCLVIAACETQHFPGHPESSPFFNQAVRTSLGLPDWEQHRAQRHETFNRALLSATDIFITACHEENGEEKPVSPWLELMINFYLLTRSFVPSGFDYSILEDERIRHLVQQNQEVTNSLTEGLPAVEEPSLSEQPFPTMSSDLLPEKLSASSYQRLINCPYQYYSSDGLRLKPLEELMDQLKKSDYGERIHRVLQCFHCGDEKYGEAFADQLNVSNRDAAEQHLEKLSKNIFHADMKNNLLHRCWLYRWQKHIPAYIDWQITQQENWRVYCCEENETTILHQHGFDDNHEDNLKLVGRLDRIDRHRQNNQHAIIDYKTGKTARQDDVDSGENIQLSMYALLDDSASQVSYLSVDSSDHKVAIKSYLQDADLEHNREQNRQRLFELFKQLKSGEALPAWGDENVCAYCDFSGLCRRESWANG